ncbi:hypothetical protein [Thalassotalea agarivorans]|uniref:Uncharacterized protein n=1 Tax=Thalassotalea agarivorans TaxID=349064 RepID=A0A1I0HI37_THASX|nr:hypothetical protein [Thalassotalea agarivorans]SET83484.1 hypothetical protein SAMN05660429_02820 [Thalassotalea agarivorans]
MTFERNQLIGQWYRNELDQQGCLVSEFAQLFADGGYEFSFVYHDKDGQVKQQSIELGDWGLCGDIHFTTAKSEYINDEHFACDLTLADNYHAYRVLELSDKVFKYQHIVTKEVFILKRVIDKIAYC